MPLPLNADRPAFLSPAVEPAEAAVASPMSALHDADPQGVDPCDLDRVLSRWAAGGQGATGSLRQLLANRWLARTPDTQPWSMPESPAMRLTWQRLSETGVPARMADWLDKTRDGAAPADADRCRRLCHAIDRIMCDDTLSALVAAHARPAPGASTDDSLALLESVVAFAEAVPGPSLAAASSLPGRGADSASPRVDSEPPSSLGAPPPTPGQNPLSADALSSQLSSISISSAEPSLLSGIPATPGRDLHIPAFHRLFSQLSTGSPGALPSLTEAFWDRPSPGQSSPVEARGERPALLERRAQAALPPLRMRQRRDAVDSHESLSSSDRSRTGSSLPSLVSVNWLPSIDFASPQGAAASTQPARSLTLSRPLIDDTLQLLRLWDDTVCTAADQILRRRAIEEIETLDAGAEPQASITLRPEAQALVRQATARVQQMSGHLAMDPDGTGVGWHPRPPEAHQALKALTAWIDGARGVSAVRRERWVDLLSHLTFSPHTPFVTSARLLTDGADLPPESATRALIPEGELLPESGTLLWRGEPLASGAHLSRLLERLALRHLDIQVTTLPSGPLPGALRRADLGVVTLHRSEPLSPEALGSLISRLEAELPALYLIRLARRERLAPGSLPASWAGSAQHPGWLVHRRRDANRERLAPLRGLWPGRRIPPALRTLAVNVLPDGEPVLDYIAHVRELRSHAGQFRAKDVTLCARLATVVDGLASDAAFARRCRELAEAPLGPCADAGMLTLASMAALREMSEARTLPELAENAFIQACLMRADAHGAAHGSEHDPERAEVLELAMVLRWHVSLRLADLLANGRIRLSDKPMFGAAGAGRDWDQARRRKDFRQQALALVAQEVEDGFAGVQAMLSTPEHPLSAVFQARIDQDLDLSALDARELAAKDAYAEALERGEDESVALTRATDALGEIEAARGMSRMDALRPTLDAIAAQVRRALARERRAAEPAEAPPSKRPRRDAP